MVGGGSSSDEESLHELGAWIIKPDEAERR
jgi:hypothetical protein